MFADKVPSLGLTSTVSLIRAEICSGPDLASYVCQLIDRTWRTMGEGLMEAL